MFSSFEVQPHTNGYAVTPTVLIVSAVLTEGGSGNKVKSRFGLFDICDDTVIQVLVLVNWQMGASPPRSIMFG